MKIPPQAKTQFWAKKEGGKPHNRQKFNQLGFGSNFQGNLKPIQDCDYGENLPHPNKPKLNFKQKKGGHPKLGKNSTNSDLA